MERFIFVIISILTTEIHSRLMLFVCFFLTAANVYATQTPIIISSADNRHHQSLVKSISLHLTDDNIKVLTLDIDKREIIHNSRDLIISIGSEAASFIDKNNPSSPHLKVLTKASLINRPKQKNKFYLSMTPPLCQQFALIKLLNNEWKTVSVLLEKPSIHLRHELKSCADKFGLNLNTILINEYVNIIDALNTSLLSSDVLLALPNPSIYNIRTIKSILLTTYRHRIPIVGFSESFVRAGALAAIFSSEKQLGKQISELITKHYSQNKIRQHYIYPEYFKVTINTNVAKSLRIITPDEKTLTDKLKHEQK